jgi:hypothetical protein
MLRACRAMRSGVTLGFLFAGLTATTLLAAGGWRYYRTPLAVRGYQPAHALFRPSGPIGQTLGLVGGLMMLVPFLYMLRKRVKSDWWPGSMKAWLEVHLFCGIAGPALVTFHTSFKFNGLVAVAYWSMVTVAVSGFVGRYLYVRLPRSIRGTELSRADLDREANELSRHLADIPDAALWLDRARALERDIRPTYLGLVFGDIGLRLKIRRFARFLAGSALTSAQQKTLTDLVAERAVLLRRMAYLQRTRTAFSLWHVFHVPFVYLLLVIVCVHIGVTVYLGYVPFRW